MSLSERALLLSLTISCWNGQVVVDVDDKVHSGLDPERDSIRHQVVPKAVLTGLQAHARALRATHVRLTAPWDDNGLRMLPSGELFTYREKIKERQAMYDRAVDEHMTLLSSMIEPQYAKYRDGLRERFGSRLSLYAVPDTGMPILADIVDREVRSALVEAVQADVNARTREAFQQTADAILRRLHMWASFKDRECDMAKRTYEHISSLKTILDTLVPGLPHPVDPTFRSALEAHGYGQV